MFKYLSVPFVLLLLVSCMSTAPVQKESPRRQFESVSTEGKSFSDLFVANEYEKSSFTPTENSRKYSTALFLSDLELLDSVSEADFQRVSDVLFSEFPNGDQEKLVVIPSLSDYTAKGDEKVPIERDAYLFIKKAPAQGGLQTYRVETNIPIASIYATDYDGYVLRRRANLYKDNVPARWVAILNIAYNESIVLYEGVAFPNRAAPLIYTGTGIGPDRFMKRIVAAGANIQNVAKELDEFVSRATAELPADLAQKASVLFLRKYTQISLAAYEYLAGSSDRSIDHYGKALSVDVTVPQDEKGSQYRYLEKIMKYLLKA